MHHAARPVLSGREAQLRHHPGPHRLPPAQCSRSMAGEQIVNASALHVPCTLIQTICSSSWGEIRKWLSRPENRVQSIDVKMGKRCKHKKNKQSCFCSNASCYVCQQEWSVGWSTSYPTRRSLHQQQGLAMVRVTVLTFYASGSTSGWQAYSL